MDEAGNAPMTQTPSYEHLTLLGQHVAQPANPNDAKLERVANPAAGKLYLVRLTCPEFTSLCPLTGQPDFAHIMVDYVPKDWIVESKSFKFLMGSYRNHRTFHEACTMEIAGKLVDLLAPLWLRIGAYWFPRGGIPIDIFWQSDAPPAGVWVPPQDVPHYRGRG
jgi:7-cyano-7-deazaguanine reductase